MSTHKYLDSTGLGQVWGKIKDLIPDSDIFIVNLSSPGPVADKTYAEIKAAHDAGKFCICIGVAPKYEYPLVAINSSAAFFSANIMTSNTAERTMAQTIVIYSSGTVSVWDSKNSYTVDGTKNLFSLKNNITVVNGTENINTGVTSFSDTAVQAYSEGDLFWLNYNILAKATTDIASGATLTENTNYVKTTIADELKSASSTPDWDENDSTSDAYIANRTHYRTSLGSMSNLHPLIHGNDHWGEGSFTGESGNTYGFADIWYFNFDDDYDSLMSDFPDGSITLLDLENPEITVIADSTELELTYIKKPITDSEYSVYVFYNNDFEISYTDNTDGHVPSEFTIASNTEHESIEIKLKMSTEIYEYHTLDDRYLNGYLIKKGTGFNSEIFNGIASYETYQIYISGDANVLEYTFATPGQMPPEGVSYCVSAIKVEGHDDVEVVNIEIDRVHNHYGITFNKTFDAELPVEDYPIDIIVPSRIASGDYSHLEGKARYALGEASHAEGNDTTASGYISHAEGNGTTASGNYSHAEGSNTTASGNSSHTEGNRTTASGDYSHAEGEATTASGNRSHAEGSSTTASGYASHAEGISTTAFGNYSHAEGAGTSAQRRSQHVFGEYNVLDTTGASKSSKGSYIEIVGKGTGDNARSNARTLDWSGNEVLAGKLTVGTGPTNNMDVATKQYVDNAVSGGGGSSTLVDLTDTTITSPTNGQVLMYNSTTSKWENTSLPIYNGGVSS